MDTSQLGIVVGSIVACVTALARAFRWAVKYAVDRLTKAKDDSTSALIAATASDAVLAQKLDANTAALRQLTDRIDDLLRAERRPSGVREAVPEPIDSTRTDTIRRVRAAASEARR